MKRMLQKKNPKKLSSSANVTPSAVWVPETSADQNQQNDRDTRITSIKKKGPSRTIDNLKADTRDSHHSDGNTSYDSGLDPDVLAALPEDIRREIMEHETRRLQMETSRQDVRDRAFFEEQNSTAFRSLASASSISIPEGSDLDPLALAALPDDIRDEMLNSEIQRLQAEKLESSDQEMARALADCSLERTDGTGMGSSTESISLSPVRPHRSNEMIENQNVDEGVYDGATNSYGQRHGDGNIRWTNGDTFKGKFKNGLRNGLGTLTFADGSFYSGGWKNDQFHGCGTRRFPSGCVYTGSFEYNKCNGQGQCVFPNGDSYIGQWKDGFMDGQGSYTQSNGDLYEGMQRCNKKHGPGRFCPKNGKIEVARYNNGVRVGYGIRWSTNKRKAWLLKGTKKVQLVSADQAYSIEEKVLSDLDNRFVENLEYHISST